YGYVALMFVGSLLMSACGPFGSSSPTQAPGTIVFGSGIQRVSAYEFVVKKPRSTFRDGQVMGWVAQLSRPIGHGTVSVEVLNAATKQSLYETPLSGTKPKWIQLAKSAPVDVFVKAGGTRGPV